MLGSPETQTQIQTQLNKIITPKGQAIEGQSEKQKDKAGKTDKCATISDTSVLT